MAEHRAKLRSLFGRPDIVAKVRDEFARSAAWLPDYFTEQARGGTQFEADEIVQIGWTLVKLTAGSNGDLEVFEPDFVSLPIQWIEGANECIRTLALQREVCQHLGVVPQFPSITQPMDDCSGDLGDNRTFAFGRVTVEGGHSGWVLDGAEEPMRMSLYQAAIANRAIVPFLALPADAMVNRGGDRWEITCQGRTISSDTNPFLARLLQGLDSGNQD